MMIPSWALVQASNFFAIAWFQKNGIRSGNERTDLKILW